MGGVAIVILTAADAEESLTDVDTLSRQWAAAVDAAVTRVSHADLEVGVAWHFGERCLSVFI